MSYSDYIVYVDESGDPNLGNPDPNYPMFVLAFCIFRKSDYVGHVSPSIQNLKFKHFGHDAIILHEREIRKQMPPFTFLQSERKRAEFMQDVDDLVRNAPMTVIAAAIDKVALISRYPTPHDPYRLSLKFCVERLTMFLARRSSQGVTHIIVEKRGQAEDKSLELEFRRIKDGRNFRVERLGDIEIVFTDKKANSGGLQLADLIARPIGIKQLRPDQPNRAFEIISEKFDRNQAGRFNGFGLKCFP